MSSATAQTAEVLMDANPGSFDSLYDPGGITAAQYRSLVGASRSDRPALRLMEAVLARAMQDFVSLGARRGSAARAEFAGVRAWVDCRASDEPFSFERICEALLLDSDAVREALERRLAAEGSTSEPARRGAAFRHCAGRRLRRGARSWSAARAESQLGSLARRGTEAC